METVKSGGAHSVVAAVTGVLLYPPAEASDPYLIFCNQVP